MKPKDGAPPRHGGKSVLVGCWFIQRGPRGRPEATGRIARGVGPGEYVLVYLSREPGVPALAPTATLEQMSKHNFECWAHEANWRRAYADAERQGVTDGKVPA